MKDVLSHTRLWQISDVKTADLAIVDHLFSHCLPLVWLEENVLKVL